MKKLGKLSLKKEKMLSHEELVSFRGGSGWYLCTCNSGGESVTCSEDLKDDLRCCTVHYPNSTSITC